MFIRTGPFPRGAPALAGVLPFNSVWPVINVGRGTQTCGMVALLVLAGCQSSRPPETAPELAAAHAAGLQHAIEFRVEGGPDDRPVEASVLTLPDAVRLAATTDPGIQAALARVRGALADAHQARLLPNPILNLALRFPEGGGKPVIEASLAQDIISLFRIPRASSAADNRLRQASAAAITTTLDVVSRVQECYASAQAIEELLPVLEQRKAILGKGIDVAEARLSAGEGIREDVTVLRTQRVELDVEYAEAAQQLRDERLRLARLIGHPSAAATWKLEPWTPPAFTDFPEAMWISAGLAHRPEIQEQVWRLAALGDELALASLVPLDGASAGVQAQRESDWQVGPELSVPIPIFDTGQAGSDRVKAEQIEARHDLVQVRRQVIEDVRRSLESLARARENALRVRRELIPLQEQRRQEADASFKAGQSDATPLFLAEQDLKAAQAKAIELDRKATLAAIGLQRAVGGPGPAAAVAFAVSSEPAVTTEPTMSPSGQPPAR